MRAGQCSSCTFSCLAHLGVVPLAARAPSVRLTLRAWGAPRQACMDNSKFTTDVPLMERPPASSAEHA